jgi:Ca2+-binding EF-hand superfamily protein
VAAKHLTQLNREQIGLFSGFERSTRIDTAFLQEFSAILFEFCDQDKDGVVNSMDFLRIFAAWHSENYWHRYNIFYNQFADSDGNLTLQQLTKLIQYANAAKLTRIAYYCRSTMMGLHPRASEMTKLVQSHDWAAFYTESATKIFKKLNKEETAKISKTDMIKYFDDKAERQSFSASLNIMGVEKKLIAQSKQMT